MDSLLGPPYVCVKHCTLAQVYCLMVKRRTQRLGILVGGYVKLYKHPQETLNACWMASLRCYALCTYSTVLRKLSRNRSDNMKSRDDDIEWTRWALHIWILMNRMRIQKTRERRYFFIFSKTLLEKILPNIINNTPGNSILCFLNCFFIPTISKKMR